VRVLVTGAARAIGRATVDVLAARGHVVVATARDVSALEGAPAARVLPLDVTDPASVTAAVAQAGELDAVADALEDPETPLRVEVGADAAMVLDLRRTLSDAEFEATMREALGLTW